MFVTLVAVLIALILGHVAPSLAASVRHYGWYDTWLRWLDGRLAHNEFWRGRFGIAFGLLPPLLAVALFQNALQAPLLGLAGLMFGVAMLFYAWGPRDLDVDVDAIVEASDPLTRRAAAARLRPEAGPEASAAEQWSPPLDTPSLVEAVFRNAMRRWFGVLFWFLLLGAFGALLYRLVALAAEGEPRRALPPEAANGAHALLTLLDWPVAQLMTLSMALVGNFDTAVGAWKDAGGASLQLDTGFLGAAGRASVRSELADEAQEYSEAGASTAGGIVIQLGELPELRDAMSLVWRILLVWLAVLALFVVAGWVS